MKLVPTYVHKDKYHDVSIMYVVVSASPLRGGMALLLEKTENGGVELVRVEGAKLRGYGSK